MTQPIAALLAVLLVLEAKHFIVDYPLQAAYQLKNKGTYGHPGGILHSGLHVVGTSAAFLLITPTLAIAAAIMVGEFLLHYHIDWSKENLVRWAGLDAKDRGFWLAIGGDQFLHHLTYLAIAAALAISA